MDECVSADKPEIKWLAWMNARPRLLLATCAVLLATQTSCMWYPSPDGARYLSLAKSFSNFESPKMFGDDSIYIAPFYSLIISPFFLISDRPFVWLSLFEWCMAMLLMGGVYRWAKLACPRWAVFLTCMVVLNHSVSLYYRRTLKETLFMALTIWVVNLMHALLANRSSKATTALTAAGAASLLCMLTLTRFVALVFVAGFAICLLVQAYRRRAGYVRAVLLTSAVAIPPTAVLFGWLMFTANFAHEGYFVAASRPYVEKIVVPKAAAVVRQDNGAPKSVASTPAPVATEVRTSLAVHWDILWEGVRYRTSDLSRLLVPGMWKAPALQLDARHSPLLFIYLPVAALCFIGWWRMARERLDVLVYSTPFWIVAYFHSSAEVYGRVFNPLLPVLCVGFWYGLRAFLNSRRTAAVMALLMLGNLAQGSAFWLLIDRPKTVLVQKQWPAVEELSGFLREHPQPVAISDRIDQQVWLMLEFDLNREVQHPLTTRSLQNDAQWFVRLKADAADVALETRFSAGDYVVLARQRQTIAGTTRPAN